MQPSTLKDDLGPIDSEMGNFGHITYGQTLIGRVFSPDGVNLDGCLPFEDAQFSGIVTKEDVRNQFIIVNRGNCSNPMKVKNIEEYGASVALIVEDREGDLEDEVMIDHYGSGQSVKIPSFLVGKEQGHKIMNSVTKGEVVMMNASLAIHNKNNEVEIGLLYGSSLDLHAANLRAFSDIAYQSAKTRYKGLLKLRIHTFSCEGCPEEIKTENCVSHGKYCAFFPKDSNIEQDRIFDDEKNGDQTATYTGDKKMDFTGRELLISSLQEQCYHEHILDLIENSDGGGTLNMER